MRALLTACLMLPILTGTLVAQNPTPAQKEWALATTGILTEMSGRRHDLLAGMESTPADERAIRSQLDYWWRIQNRDDLLNQLDGLQSTEPNAWDLVRYINLCRLGYAVHFLTEDEAWSRVMPGARTLQQLFSSWRELGRSYLIRREQWAQRDDWNANGDYVYRQLLWRKTSPWRRIPWNLDLGGLPVRNSTDTVAFLTLISRPAGLTCFALYVLDRTPRSSLMPDMQRLLGCGGVRVIEERQREGDWSAAGDCFRPDLARGAQMRAEFPLERIASRLRAEGTVELFVSISHTPAGRSLLSPPAKFHWINGGMEYDIGSYDLNSALPFLHLSYGFEPPEVSRFYFAAILFSLAILVLAVWRKQAYRLLHWAGWTLLVTVTDAIAIVRLTLGEEGLRGDLTALGLLVLFPLAIEVAIGPIVLPNLPGLQALRAAFWSNLVVVPFAALALMVADLQGGLNREMIFACSALAFMIVAISLRNLHLATGVAGVIVPEGELRERVFEIAHTAAVRVRRFCLVREGGNPVGAFASGGRSVLISEEIIARLSKREVDALAARALVGLRSHELQKLLLAVAVMTTGVFLGASWYVYWLGRVGTLLLICGGLTLAGLIAWALSRYWQCTADRKAVALTKDPEAFISALVKSEGMLRGRSGFATVRARRIASRYRITEERFLEIVEPGEMKPEQYAVPLVTGPPIYSPV